MKLKSWTGTYVDARVGMVVCFNPHERFIITRINTSSIEFNSDNCYGETHLPELLTMLHCPFQVGDEYEMVCGDGLCSWKHEGRIRMQSKAALMNEQIPELFYRHANPDLRTSPEYKI